MKFWYCLYYPDDGSLPTVQFFDTSEELDDFLDNPVLDEIETGEVQLPIKGV